MASDKKICKELMPNFMNGEAPLLQFIYDCRLMDGIAAA